MTNDGHRGAICGGGGIGGNGEVTLGHMYMCVCIWGSEVKSHHWIG